MHLRSCRVLRCPKPRRSLHTSAPLQSTYRGYNMHGTLREWALRQLRKEDMLIQKRSRPRERVVKHQPYLHRLQELADEYVVNELRKQERRNRPPVGHAGRLVRAGDALLEGAEDPFAARGRTAGQKVVRDRRGRLREALRLYMRAAQRPDKSMPIIGSRVWGTTAYLERRILNTLKKLDTAEKIIRGHYDRPVQDTINWGIRTRDGFEKARTANEEKEPLRRPSAGSPKNVERPSAFGLAYKMQPALPPLHRLAPSAVERARMPLLQAFPGAGAVGGQVLSLGHAFYASRGLLGTPPPSAASTCTSHATPPSAFAPTGEPRPFYTPPVVSAPSPSHSPASASFPSSSASSSNADPNLVRGPPWTRRGKMLRWMRTSKKRENIAMRYFPAPHAPAPAHVTPAGPGGAPGEYVGGAGDSVLGRESASGLVRDGGVPAWASAVVVGAGRGSTRVSPELASVRTPVGFLLIFDFRFPPRPR
ncbi:hypothetical protein C8R47DRAFT_630936 [Mycena vitilis]|nr:hypothetical protein C8R47DRAFT_630936 [Mycena vitilis]